MVLRLSRGHSHPPRCLFCLNVGFCLYHPRRIVGSSPGLEAAPKPWTYLPARESSQCSWAPELPQSRFVPLLPGRLPFPFDLTPKRLNVLQCLKGLSPLFFVLLSSPPPSRSDYVDKNVKLAFSSLVYLQRFLWAFFFFPLWCMIQHCVKGGVLLNKRAVCFSGSVSSLYSNTNRHSCTHIALGSPGEPWGSPGPSLRKPPACLPAALGGS